MNKLGLPVLSILFSAACATHPTAGDMPGSDSGSDAGSDTGSNSGSDTGVTVDQVLATGGEFVDPPAEHGEQAVGAPSAETLTYNDGTQWSCATQKISIQQDPQEFVTLNPDADVIFPGSLVQGGTLDSGTPEPIPVRRGGGTIVLSLVNGTNAAYQQQVDEATQGNITDAQNHLLAGISNTAIPAKFSYDYGMYDSADKFAADISVKASWIGGSSLSSAVDFSQDHHYTRAVLRLSQEYFTTTFQTPTSTGAFFAPDLQGSELAPYVGPNNPAGYISEVTYGRQFYLVFESTASTTDLKTAVDAVYSGAIADVNAQMSTDLLHTQQQTTVKAYAIGGASDTALAVALAASNQADTNGLFQSLSAYLRSGGTFSPANPGLPVSYTVRDVVHRNIVKVNLGDEYDVLKCSPLVSAARVALSLDANHASWANNQMTAWPGDTTAQNQPTSISNIAFGETDANGQTWARLGSTSSAPGIDCGWVSSGQYTIVSVTKPRIGGNGGLLVSAGQEVNMGLYTSTQGWGTGWTANSEYLNLENGLHQYAQTAWSIAMQSSGHVSTQQFVSGTGSQAWANGVALTRLGNDSEGMAPTVANCSIGTADGNFGPGFDGEVGEIRAYRGTLSQAERQFVECQLGAKWGIGVDGCANGRPVNSY